MSDKTFNFKIVTPSSSIGPLPCDSLKFSISDGNSDKKGGLYGVRKGHTEALFALQSGKTEAFLNSELIFSAQTSGGFAKVSPKLVTIVVDNVIIVSQ